MKFHNFVTIVGFATFVLGIIFGDDTQKIIGAIFMASGWIKESIEEKL